MQIGYARVSTEDQNLDLQNDALLQAEDRPKATLHSFRTTFNNRLRDLGLQIEDRQILLAQSASETTKIYTHPNFELAKQYVNKIPEIMGL